MTNDFSCVTYNVNGLNDSKKWRDVFNYLHSKKYDVIYLQETHSTKKDEILWSTEWGNKIWFDHGVGNSRGVAILFSKAITPHIHNTFVSKDGRIIALYITLGDRKLVLANIYAPNKDEVNFFEDAFKEIEKYNPMYYVIGGDLNLGLDPKVDRYGSVTNNDKSANWLNTHLTNHKYVDVWRNFYPELNGFTWRRLRPKRIFSRLDYFLVSESFIQFINKVNIKPGYRTDHSIVEMKINFSFHKRGPGYWKLNNSLLYDEEYLKSINKLINIEMENVKIGEYRKRWELLKLAIRGTTLQFAVRKKKSNRNKIEVLERKLAKLEREVIDRNYLFKDTEEQIRLVKQEISQIQQEKTKGTIIRAKANWEFLGEHSTKYFLKLERNNYVNKTLYRVRKSNGEVTENKDEILDEIKTFYEKLYKSQGPISTQYIEKLEIPKISEDLQIELEKPISQAEISIALKKLKKNKTPGCDGLSADFYKMFYRKLKPILLNLYHEIVEMKEFHLNAKRGVLSLLEKIGKDMLALNNWRPLTLLNTDNKIFTKILANRMEKAMSQKIHHTQTGFIKGRHLAENIIKINEVMEHCETNRIDSMIVSFDFQKAFDTVEWEAIYLALEKFGFGKYFIEMIKIVYKDPLICASNNGFWTDFFNPSRATRQGCCLSPSIFNLIVELLGLGIRQNKKIEGIKINGEEIKSGQFADDLWTSLLAKQENLDQIIQEIEEFGKMSGLKLNYEKCAILKVGPWRDSEAKFYTLKRLFWSPTSLKILGIQIYPDKQIMYHDNFIDMLDKVEDILKAWKFRNLTPLGKIRVVNDLVNSLFSHKFLALPTPPTTFFSLYKKK